MHKFTLIALSTLMVIGALSAEALALDGYRDRRGVFYGLSLGGGSSKSNADGAESHLGLNLRARAGGGITQNLTLDTELGIHSSSDANIDVLTLSLGSRYFINDGLYFHGGAGLSQMSGTGDSDVSETGLIASLGLGYEFFASSDLAISVGADFQHQVYDDNNLQLIGINVSTTWY